jgi:16S rRNA (cytosine967-C5)-methyltransferase
MANARKIAALALKKVDFGGGYSGIVLDSMLKNSKLSRVDQSLASALFYGVLDRKITIDYVISRHIRQPLRKITPLALESLRIGAYQLMYMDKIPASAAVNESVKLVKSSDENRASGFVNAVLRSIERCGDYGIPQDNSAESVSLRYSCPRWIVDGFIADYGVNNTIGILEHSLLPTVTYARVNTMKITPEELIKSLADEGVVSLLCDGRSNAVEIRLNGSVRELNAYRDGLFHVQDLSSQLCAEAVGTEKKFRVLDICSAPGGKAFTMAEIMEGGGEVVACDLHAHRVKLIEDGARRLGLENITARVSDATVFDPELGEFDRVLCDVPCSGLGVIGRKPDIKQKSAEEISRLPQIQHSILTNASKYLKPGGRIVYSTCSLSKAENEAVFGRFLKENSNFEPYEIRDNSHMITLMPHIDVTDGFFIASAVRIR